VDHQGSAADLLPTLLSKPANGQWISETSFKSNWSKKQRLTAYDWHIRMPQAEAMADSLRQANPAPGARIASPCRSAAQYLRQLLGRKQATKHRLAFSRLPILLKPTITSQRSSERLLKSTARPVQDRAQTARGLTPIRHQCVLGPVTASHRQTLALIDDR